MYVYKEYVQSNVSHIFEVGQTSLQKPRFKFLAKYSFLQVVVSSSILQALKDRTSFPYALSTGAGELFWKSSPQQQHRGRQ